MFNVYYVFSFFSHLCTEFQVLGMRYGYVREKRMVKHQEIYSIRYIMQMLGTNSSVIILTWIYVATPPKSQLGGGLQPYKNIRLLQDQESYNPLVHSQRGDFQSLIALTPLVIARGETVAIYKYTAIKQRKLGSVQTSYNQEQTRNR